jgi:hypothetical protein
MRGASETNTAMLEAARKCESDCFDGESAITSHDQYGVTVRFLALSLCITALRHCAGRKRGRARAAFSATVLVSGETRERG